jgi:hypothetical protein
MVKKIKNAVRDILLALINHHRIRRFLAPGEFPNRTPIFLVVTRDLVHMAPLAVATRHPDFAPVFVGNGISPEDESWLATMCPDTPVISLKASLATGNPASMLDHGAVLQYLLELVPGTFCIQDPDCFIIQKTFFETIALDEKHEYAVGPFVRIAPNEVMPRMPQTFFLMLNAPLFRELRREYGLSARVTRIPDSRLVPLLAAGGFPPGHYPHQVKGYFDTLHMFWIAAEQLGRRFTVIPGAEETVCHIGGTSYLFRVTENLEHWDYWPLNAHYIHLKLLSMPACTRFRKRFAALIALRDTPEKLLERYPAYRNGRRFAQTRAILENLQAEKLYGGDIHE